MQVFRKWCCSAQYLLQLRQFLIEFQVGGVGSGWYGCCIGMSYGVQGMTIPGSTGNFTLSPIDPLLH
jgi:hypothetical protein